MDIARSYLQRTSNLLQARTYDLIWLEYEAFPWVPYSIERLLCSFASRVPYVVDYDDAVFHRYDQHVSRLVRLGLGEKIDRVMERAAVVIAGNDYLAIRAKEAGAKKIVILPTVLDLERYPDGSSPQNSVFTIGWVGTPQTSHYLETVREALKHVCADRNGRVSIVGARNVDLGDVPYEIRPWSLETEVQEISGFDVGIMPLPDSPWERGKCGHKLIKYMACSLPVVASPVGVNGTIVEHGTNGFLARTTDDWIRALTTLREDPALRIKMGRAGRLKVERMYNTSVTAPRLAALLREASKGHH